MRRQTRWGAHGPRSLGMAVLLSAATLAACGGGDGTSIGGTTLPPPAVAPETAVAAPKACELGSLASVQLSNAKVTSVASIPAGTYTPTGSFSGLANLPAFCLVKAQATPTSDSLINFEVWVPQGSAWNGKLVATGNGGYSNALSYGDMAYAMRQGYATLGGDTGHQTSIDFFWGISHPEKIIDWGTRSINAITAPGKKIIAELQAKEASRAYYYGCSTGGHQGYAEVQRYPQDFDGVIAGAPGNNRVALNAEFLWRYQSNRPTGSTTLVLTTAKAQLLTSSAIAACDALDGVTDGVIDDPRACTSAVFNIDALQCTGADAPNCLTAPQVAAAKKIYQGPKNPATNALIYPGPVVGTESGWSSYWGTTEPTRADFWRLWVYENPAWDHWTFDYNRDMAFSVAKVGGMVDQTNPDIAAFKARGGKLITYQGWADPVVSILDTIAYYDKVKTLQGSQAETDKFFRLFLAPGMGHCSGGSGPNVFGNGGLSAPAPTPQNDLLMALDRWVDQGVAPDSVTASRVSGGTVTRTRPLCAYPKKAVYKGSGSTDDAASFSCT